MPLLQPAARRLNDYAMVSTAPKPPARALDMVRMHLHIVDSAASASHTSQLALSLGGFEVAAALLSHVRWGVCVLPRCPSGVTGPSGFVFVIHITIHTVQSS